MIQLKKTILTLVALLAVTTGAWAQGPVDGTIAWSVGNEASATVSASIMDAISSTGVTTGSGLTVSTCKYFDTNMMKYQPSTANAGNVSGVMIEYTIEAVDGYKFKPTGVDYAAVKDGSDNISYSWSYTIDGVESAITDVSKDDLLRSNGSNSGTAQLMHSESITADGCSVFTLRFYISNCGTSKNICIGNITISGSVSAAAASGPEVAWDKAKKTGTFTMPGGNVTLEPEYYPQAALTAVPTAINDVPATTDGAIVKVGTVANIGSTTTAQGTVMYYVSPTALDDAALLALAADAWKADVPTAESLAQGQAYVYYYVRGNDSDTDEENFSDGDILSANALTVTIAAEPTKVTMAVNDKTMGTVEVGGESKVEWTADTWKGWTASTKEHTVDDITMTSTNSAYIWEITEAGDYLNSLFFYVSQEDNNSTVTFSTTGDPFSRIEFTMIDDYDEDHLVSNRWVGNPVIMPKDNWTFSGKSAVWEGEATKSLTLKSCTTYVSKITFFKGAVPDGVTVNGDGTFTVAKTATVTLTATPAEGYKFLYWEDDQTNTNPVREVTIEPGMADMTYKAVFAEPTFNVTFVEGTNLNEWKAEPNTGVKKGQTVTVTYTGSKKVLGVKAEKKGGGEPVLLTTITAADNSSFKSGSQTFGDVATVTLTGDYLINDGSHGGWYCQGSNKTATISVAEANGANITSVKFYTAGGGSAEDKDAPFEVTTTTVTSSDITTYLNGNSIGSYGVSKIEVYGTK